MSHDGNPEWLLPAAIPFNQLKAKDLEECVYWLFDALGARDLEWRTGGSGGGAADGGRDLEATFYVPSPDGEMEAERWWIECKGRKDTLEADAVKSAVNNAAALGDLACMVIVTNTTFSNPTRDWVKTWQASHRQPKVKLWDQATLERQLSRHPSVVLRLFAEALSPTGRLQALRERFWNKLEYTPPKTLAHLWQARGTLEIGPLDRVALITNEFAHGSIEQHPWAAAAKPDELFDTLQIGLVNLPYLWMRAHSAGVDSSVLIRSFAYLILAVLQLAAADGVANHMLALLKERDGVTLPDEVVEVLLLPILGQLAAEMQDVCSTDCDRFCLPERRTLRQQNDPIENYWKRLEPEGVPANDGPQQYLRIEKTTEPCRVGFAVDHEQSCPLYEVDPSLSNLVEFLSIIERVSEFRLKQARPNHKPSLT